VNKIIISNYIWNSICRNWMLPSAECIYHLSYCLVEIATVTIKTLTWHCFWRLYLVDEWSVLHRQQQMSGESCRFHAEELKTSGVSIGRGALKFYLLRVLSTKDKTLIFNPEESIDFHGCTGPFVSVYFRRMASNLYWDNEYQSWWFDFRSLNAYFNINNQGGTLLLLVLESHSF